MPERNNRGFLTVDSLLKGDLDQYAVMRGGKQIVIELGAYPQAPIRRFYVKHTVSEKGIVVESRLQTFIAPDKARTRFRELVRSNP